MREFLQRIDPRHSFQPRITAVALLLTLGGVTLISFVGATTAADRIEEGVKNTLRAVAVETVGGHIENELRDLLDDLSAISSQLTDDFAAHHRQLATYLALNSDAAWVALYGADGTVVDSAGMPPPSRVTSSSWFRAAQADLTISAENDGDGILLAVPLQRHGVIAARINRIWLDKIEAQVSRLLRAHGSARLAIADSHGRAILGSPIFATLSASTPADSVSVRTAADSREYLIATHRLHSTPVTGLGWSVVVAEPMDVALAPARAVQQTILRAGIIISIVAMVISWLMITGIIKPLRNLAQFAMLAQNDRALDVPYTARNDEIGTLSRAWSAMLVRLADERAQMTLVNNEVTRALTSKTAFQRELEQERFRSQTLLDSLPGVAYRCSADALRTLDFVSAGAASLLRRSPVQLLGDRSQLNEFIAPEDRDNVIAQINQSIEERREYDLLYRLDLGGGDSISVWDHGRVITMADENRSFLTGFLTDVSELQSLRNEVNQANRLATLGHLVAVTAHELNNVLMSVQPAAELVERVTQKPAIQAAARQITAAVRRGKHITSEILRYTRPASPALEQIEFDSWLPSFLDSVRESLRHVVIDVPPFQSPSYIRVDPAQLHQVLLNLLFNARDAIADRAGRITIGRSHVRDALTSPSAALRIDVSDNGEGMPPEVMARIFDPLFTTKRKGTGLGLAVARQLVEANAGHIEVRSEAGSGTTFSLFFPLVPAELRPESDRQQEEFMAQGLSVLIVDDEPTVTSGLAILLELHGLHVTTATNGRELFAALEHNVPDVLILDVGLPDIDGVEAFTRVASRHPSLPVVFSTGRLTDVRLENLPPHTRVLVKPYDIDTLLRAVSDLVKPRGATG